MSRVAAIILAGGKAERLGGINKALLEVGGTKLIDRAKAVVAGCAPVLLSVGRAAFELEGMVHVPDLPGDYAGPLAGVAAGIDWLRAEPPEMVLTLAVDTPFFPLDFLARALPLMASAPAVLGAFGGQDYPTNGLWRFAEVAGLPDGVREGTAPHSLKRLAERLGAARLDYAGLVSEDPFVNANTPQDLAFLRLRASRIP